MRRKAINMIVVFTTLGLLSGCQNGKSLITSVPATDALGNQEVATPSNAESVGNQNEISTKKYIYVPDTFVVYEDGNPHRLMYAADQDYYYYGTFTNVQLPDYGFENISLPSSLTEVSFTVPDGKTLEEIDIGNLEENSVIDASACFSQTRNIYSVRTPGLYLFHVWSQKYDGEIHTLTLKDFANILNIGGSLTSDFEDMELLEDGSTRYTCRYKDDREYTGDGIPYYGKAVIRLKDGRAWCGIFAEKDHEDGPRMAEYVLKQSVVYKEDEINE